MADKLAYHGGPLWVRAGLFDLNPKRPEHKYGKRGLTSLRRCAHEVVSSEGRWCLVCDARMDEQWRQAWLETGMHSPRRPQARAAADAVKEVA